MESKEEQERRILSEHMSKLGKKGGATNRRKGSEYFRRIRAVRTENERKRTLGQSD